MNIAFTGARWGKNPIARKEIILGESQRKIKRKKKEKNQCQKRNLSGRKPEEKEIKVEIKIEMKPQNNVDNLVS